MVDMKPKTNTELEFRELSSIKVFQLFEKAVAKINRYPFTSDNIITQQDAYRRLADDTLTDEEFAVLECSRKDKDSALRFAIIFSNGGFALSVESVGSFFWQYDTGFKSEKDTVRQIMETLQMLANGQIASLMTVHNGKWCATETLLFEPGNRKPIVIGTEGKYPKLLRAKEESGYETFILRNNYLEDQITIPKKQSLFVERLPDGTMPVKGRVFDTPELTPLTKAKYNAFVNEHMLRIAGAAADETAIGLLYRSWEFWVFMVLIIGVIQVGIAIDWLPEFINSVPFVTWPVTIFLLGTVLFPILQRKHQLSIHQPNHWWFTLDRFIKANIFNAGKALLAVVLFIASFWPVYLLPGTHDAVNLYQLHIPAAVMYGLPGIFVISAIIGLVRTNMARLWYVISIFVGTILGFVVNFVATNPDGYTPEPYTTITIIAHLTGVIGGGVGLWKWFRAKK